MIRYVAGMLALVGFTWAYTPKYKPVEVTPDMKPSGKAVKVPHLFWLGDQVGTTEYDYPNNSWFKDIAVYPSGGSVHITYMRLETGSQDTRSMFYNFYDGSAWIDNVGVDAMNSGTEGRNGFGSLDLLSDGRALISAHMNDQGLIGKFALENGYLDGSFTLGNMPNAPVNNACYYAKIFVAGSNLIAICQDGDGTDPDTNLVFYSDDNGATWNQVTSFDDMSDVFPERYAYDYNANTGTAVIAYFSNLTWDDRAAIRFRISNDNGQTWSSYTEILNEVPYSEIFDGEFPIDTFNYTEDNPFCDPYLRMDAAVTNDGTVHIVWESLCYDGTYVADTVVDTTVTPPDTSVVPVFVPYSVVNYYNSATGQVEVIVEQDHAGDAEVGQDPAPGANRPYFFNPRLVVRGNDVFVFYLAQEGNADPQTGVPAPEIYVATRTNSGWVSTNISNTPDDCELWLDVSKRPINNTAYVMYYGDPSGACGISLFGESPTAVGGWYVFPFDLTTAFAEKVDVKDFYYNPVTKTVVFNAPYAGNVNVYRINGSLVATKKAVNGIVKLGDLSSGIYLIQAGDFTGKVVVK